MVRFRFYWWTEVDSNHRSLRRQIYSLIHLAALEPVRLLWCSAQAVEPVIGLEPTTCWLQISCSANWATPACGALRWNRTIDRRIFSPLLYQLSYQGKWRPKRGSNSWPPAWQAGALTKLSYWAIKRALQRTLDYYNLFFHIRQVFFGFFSGKTQIFFRFFQKYFSNKFSNVGCSYSSQ